MLRYVIIIFQTIWTLLHLTYALLILTGKCIFYLVTSFLSAVIVTGCTVVSCLNAFYEEVTLFFIDINKSTTAVLDCIAEQTTSNINSISKLTSGILNELCKLSNGGKQQLQNISDTITLATGWSARTLNGALFFIGDIVWSTLRLIPHLLLMPLVFVYKLVASALTFILHFLVRTVWGLLSMPLQSLFALVLIITMFQFKRRIYRLCRAVVIRLCCNIYQIFQNRRNLTRRSPGDTFAQVLDSRRSSRRSPGTSEVVRDQGNLLYRIYMTTREVLVQMYQMFASRRNRPADTTYNERRQYETRPSYRQKSPVNISSIDNSCVICQEHLKCVVLLPCKHLCLCEECAQRITLYQDTCPLCRICVRTKMTVYI